MEPLPTIVKEGSLFKATAVCIVAVGVGICVLLACWGASLFWRVDDGMAQKIDALSKKTAGLSDAVKNGQQRTADAVKEGQLRIAESVDAVGGKLDAIDHRLDSIDRRLSSLDQRVSIIGKYGPGEYKKDGNVIRREVTVFNSVPHGDGDVTTGWKYKDGGSEEPYDQFCYYMRRRLAPNRPPFPKSFMATGAISKPIRTPSLTPMACAHQSS
jgi:hypothetical protein